VFHVLDAASLPRPVVRCFGQEQFPHLPPLHFSTPVHSSRRMHRSATITSSSASHTTRKVNANANPHRESRIASETGETIGAISDYDAGRITRDELTRKQDVACQDSIS